MKLGSGCARSYIVSGWDDFSVKIASNFLQPYSQDLRFFLRLWQVLKFYQRKELASHGLNCSSESVLPICFLDDLTNIIMPKINSISDLIKYMLFENNIFNRLVIKFLMEIYCQDDDNFNQVPMQSLISYAEENVGKLPKDRIAKPTLNLNLEETVEEYYKKSKDKRKPNIELKKILKKAKVQKLKCNFIRKLKRTNVPCAVPQQIIESQIQDSFEYKNLATRILIYFQKIEGVYISAQVQAFFSFLKLLDIIIMLFVYSVMLAFPQPRINNHPFLWFRLASLVLQVCFIFLSIITIKYNGGKQIKNLKEIAQHYLKNQFYSDLLGLIAMLLAISIQSQPPSIIIVLLLLIFKLKGSLTETQKFQYIYIGSSEKQKYFGLLKILILNFSIGHILSITLNLMSNLNTDINWIIKLGIDGEPWLQKYIWGYYWGTNIMLTVGFGDIAASNYHQALALIFIETFACITLAYNISQVGSIISEMKADSEEKNKKLKYVYKMCKENDLSYDFQNKVVNFIEQSYEIKEAFEFDQYEDVINSLPKSMQTEYRIESNRSLFDIPVFNFLSNKTLVTLAEHVIRRITHPDQIVLRKGALSNFSILQRGSIGFLYKRERSLLNGVLIQKFQVKEKDKPNIISLDFIKKKILPYDLKSLSYCIIYYLQNQPFMDCLKTCELDYQLFCSIRDKDEFFIDANQIYRCSACSNQFHSKFNCPKYHYIPLKQHVIAVQLYKDRFLKQARIYDDTRAKELTPFCKSLSTASFIQKCHQNFFVEKYGEEELRQIIKIREYNKKKEQLNRKGQKMIGDGIDPKFHGIADIIIADIQIKKIEEMFEKQKPLQNTFWPIESDQVANYKYYFQQSNSDRLSNKRLTKTPHIFFD